MAHTLRNCEIENYYIFNCPIQWYFKIAGERQNILKNDANLPKPGENVAMHSLCARIKYQLYDLK